MRTKSEIPPHWEKDTGQWDVFFAACFFPKGKATVFLGCQSGITRDAKDKDLIVRDLGSKPWQYNHRQIK